VLSAVLVYGWDWKGTLGIFVTALVLVVLVKRPVVATVALLAAITYSASADGRSMAVGGVLTLIVAIGLRRPSRGAGGYVGFFAVAAVAVLATVWAMTSGLLGAIVQARTLDQLSKPAGLISGARVEWAAALELMGQRPLGFGPGVRATDAQAHDAVNAVQSAGGDFTADYFTTVMLGQRVDFHSTASNLWFHFGVGGVILAIALAVVLVRGLREAGTTRSVLGYGGIYLMFMASWDLLFSPMADVNRLIIGALVAVVAVRADERVSEGRELARSSTSSHEFPRTPRD
jgi:hypothetical protein